ncbi:hypothetical protein K458DRAFT_399493 [Lentithecium fluviatile CBS 122367]|uniref:DNA replication checkpoint mediator MRC1 domain-containing protein n=1 Tax=Lentithecium fluviatile CBS 122367 TaxID=1168545 RepID=A0A6G1JHU1_9PLEO|nr:hypothetical protein K458DRAFT_399493 [Lentithecium fluviatile CBS 122367]
MTTAMDVSEGSFGSLLETTRSAARHASNSLSKLADSDSEAENIAPLRKAGGGLLSRLRAESDDSSESDEEVSNQAIERAKQRLMLTKPVDILSSEDEDDGDDEGAYERMRKQLMASTSQQEPQKERTNEHEQKAHTIFSSSEDEDEAPVPANRARRLQSRRERTASPPTSPALSARSRRSSPGLFVTPNASPASKRTQNLFSTENDTQSTHNADFDERVKRIRAERLAMQKQKREEQKRAKTTRHEVEEDSDAKKSDGEDGRRLTQLTKPARKAGKKALEAMAREQQRIERGMQLTHQSKTKKRYGTKDLFAKFGYSQGIDGMDTGGLPTPDLSSHPASPNAEQGLQSHDTPPTSPPSFEEAPQKDEGMAGLDTPNATAPAPENTALRPAKLDKGKGRAPEFQHLPPNPLLAQSKSVTVHRAQLGPRKPAPATMVELSDSDDELEVVQPKSRFPVFDKVPEKKAQEAPSLLHLRHLAGVTSPGKRQPKGPKSMNFAQLGVSLHQKARQQAQKEREEKIEELRKKGIHVETEEEREKRQMEIEDMVALFEKQRQEDLTLAKLERKEAKANGETGDGLVSSDESEDDDYVASGDENAAEIEDQEGEEEDTELELSGSEDEAEDVTEDEEGLDEEAVNKPHGLLDETADEDDKQETEEISQDQTLDHEDAEDEEVEVPVRKRTVHRGRHVIGDEEDEDADTLPQNGSTTQMATQDNAMAAFGFGDAAPAVGLTQAFAGTMANLGSASQDDDDMPPEREQDSLDFLRSLPDTQPSVIFGQGNDLLIPNSQSAPSQQVESQNGLVSQLHLGISQLVDISPAFSRSQPFNTQLSEVPEPTQDAGFLMSRSPAGLQAPPSTIDTVMMQVEESPVAQRKGKLRRGRQATPVELSDIDDDNVFSGSDVDGEEQATTKAKDVFSVMKKAAKKQQKVDNFNKKTSRAREAIEEQAEESEDEYAGIGGASEDDSDAEVDEELAKMIDTGDIKVDERKLAAFYADKARKDDEKGINQLYKDFKSGNWRKRAAGRADFELSDSEDEAEMRRRKRQREFQQTTKALLQDERVGKIAENVKKTAFFKTLVDNFDDADYDFLNNAEEPLAETSQSQSDENNEKGEETSIPDSQTADTTAAPANPLKRKSADSQEKENRPPPNMRRTAASDLIARKPMSMADIEHSVSELLEDPRVMVPDSQYMSESEDELPAGLPTNTSKPSKPTIIDRLTLSRTSTTSITTISATTDTTMAFHAPSTTTVPGFRVPSLIRRATSNISTVSERSSGTNTPTEGGVRRGGTGRSNIHAQAREAERRAVMEKAEGKRKEALKKKAGKARAKRSVLSSLGGGFE